MHAADVFAAPHTGLCYRHKQMRVFLQSSMFVAACALFVACGAMPKKADTWNPYELRPAPAGAAMPIDNDLYYTRPGSYSCESINDAPSCVGGG
jgi:hypothetical protein